MMCLYILYWATINITTLQLGTNYQQLQKVVKYQICVCLIKSLNMLLRENGNVKWLFG